MPLRAFIALCPECGYEVLRPAFTNTGSCARVVDNYYEDVPCPQCGEQGLVAAFDEWSPQEKFEVTGEKEYLSERR